jgi:hypothetical protein
MAKVANGTTPTDADCPRLVTTSVGLDRTEAEMVFIAACISGPKHPLNSKRSLSRLQFLDCLLSIATAKFLNTKLCATLPDALEKLISECIIGNAEYHDAVAFRARYCLIECMDVTIKRCVVILERLFRQYSGELCLPNEPRAMSPDEWMRFCEQCLQGTGLVERQFKLSFNRSVHIADNYFDDAVMFKKLTRIEFYEAMVRVAHASVAAEHEGVVVGILKQNEGDDESKVEGKGETDTPESADAMMVVDAAIPAPKRVLDITPIMVQERFQLILLSAAALLPTKKKDGKKPTTGEKSRT